MDTDQRSSNIIGSSLNSVFGNFFSDIEEFFTGFFSKECAYREEELNRPESFVDLRKIVQERRKAQDFKK